MTHQEIEAREIVDAYLRGRLSDADKEAFEDHYFDCDDCFAQVQSTAKFAQSVRQAAESGLLPAVPDERDGLLAAWLRPAFALCAAGVVVLGAVCGWFALSERPKWQAEAAAQRQRLDAERARAAGLEKQIAMNRPPPVEAEPNLPLVMLEASRAASANAVTIPRGAGHLALWLEIPPDARSRTYRLEILAAVGPDQPVEKLEGLVRNSYGALAASVPAERLPSGAYKVRLFGGSGAMLAEYRLEVRR